MPSPHAKKLQEDLKFLALHRYWMWANRLREYVDKALLDTSWLKLAKAHGDNEMSRAFAFFSNDPGIFMSHWYGALYVIIEGWKQLHLSDPVIDPLLKHRNVALLKSYRNGAFHFQRNYFDARFAGFMEEKTTVEWIRTLNREFGRYFLEHITPQTTPKA